MNLLILIVVIVLMFKFPPGANIDWQIGNARMLFPLGWCLWLSVGLSILMKLVGGKS